jgi:phenylacetate-coenzyme A ligase PaaK-like adenylate-forming protein
VVQDRDDDGCRAEAAVQVRDAERLTEAFGVRPFNIYATTEGLVGVDCDRHDGVHLFEDLALVTNVDANGHPVEPGKAGAKPAGGKLQLVVADNSGR